MKIEVSRDEKQLILETLNVRATHCEIAGNPRKHDKANEYGGIDYEIGKELRDRAKKLKALFEKIRNQDDRTLNSSNEILTEWDKWSKDRLKLLCVLRGED